MRPKGEIHLALLKAVGELATPERGASLREIAARACVGIASARHTMHYLNRSGAVVIARTRRVEYRNRPISEYALPAPAPANNSDAQHWSALGAALTGWHGGELRTDSQNNPNDAPCG
jgi:hypothetical protein